LAPGASGADHEPARGETQTDLFSSTPTEAERTVDLAAGERASLLEPVQHDGFAE
jgi:hypothetical protein